MREIAIADTQLTEPEIEAAVAVLRSGALRQGKVCAEFEMAFARWVGAEHAMTCSNGSTALHLAYEAVLNVGDEVLVPSFTFIATASMVNAAGGTPIFCDVSRDTQLIDLDDAESRITERTRAIAPVHLFGNAVDVDAVLAFAGRHDLAVIWDAAQAHGTLWDGGDVGAAPGITTWSFYPTKTMFTGEGGMVCTHDSALDAKMRLNRSHGVAGRYNHVSLGLNCRMTDVEAAIGLAQMEIIDARLRTRRHNGAQLSEALSGTPLSPQQPTTRAQHSYHQFCATLDSDAAGLSREEFMQRLGEKGIASGIHYPRGVHQQPVYEEMYGKTSLQVTEDLAECILALPVHHALSQDDLDYMCESIVELVG